MWLTGCGGNIVSRCKPKLADHVHVVVGGVPYEFQTPISAWTTAAGAELEAKRLEDLVAIKTTDEAELKRIVDQTHYCEDFWVVPLDVMHQEGTHT